MLSIKSLSIKSLSIKTFSVKKFSIKTKILAIILFGVSSAIAVGLVYFILMDSKSLYRDLEQELQILTKITAKRSNAALAFLDQSKAEENLQHLEIRQSIQAGCIYTSSGELFAAYERNAESKFRCPNTRNENVNFEIFQEDRIVINEEISNKTQKLGDILLISDKSRIEAKRRDWFVLCLTMALAGLAVVGLMTNRMQKSVVQPLKNLTRIMDKVRDTSDLTLRAYHAGEDELGRLVDAFNEMLLIMERNANDLSKIYQDLIKKSTEAEDAAIELEARNEQIKGMLSGAAHDLRQPLQAMSIFVDVLDAERLPKHQQAVVDKMQRTVDNLGILFKEILDFSKLEHEHGAAELHEVDTIEFFENLQVEFDALAKNKGLEYRQRIASLTMHTNPAVLERIVRNLISNAVRYTDKGGILIAVRERGAAIWIEVWDTGCGIPEEKQQEIRNKFVAADNKARDRKGSYGLGLAIVEHLVEQLNSKLVIRSKSGRGSCFRVCIPKAGPVEKSVIAVDEAQVNSAVHQENKNIGLDNNRDVEKKFVLGKTLYLIDDESEPRELLASLLTAMGANVLSFRGLEELKQYFASKNVVEPDLIISDYQLGHGVTGDQIIQECRLHLPSGLPAFIVTGNQSDQIHREINNKGYEFLLKPVKLKDLKLKIQALTSA